MNIVLLEDLGVSSSRMDDIARHYEAMGHSFKAYARSGEIETLKAEVRDADAIIVASMPLPAEVVRSAPRLKYIDVAFTGVDHIPLDVCSQKDISVSNASGYSNDAVAELVLAFAIELLRKLPALEERAKKGESRSGLRGSLLKGKTVGIVGCGAIGRQAARLFQAFGARVLGFNRSRVNDPAIDEQTSLNELLRRSDIVSLHVPLTDQTRSMIGAMQLKQMKPTAIVINAARGPVVDSYALAQALNDGTIAGAAIDVFDQEPPLDPENEPLLSAKNTILTPHIGFDSEESMELRADIVCSNLDGWLQGEIRNQIV